MNRQTVIFFLLSVLAWASETTCPDCTRLKRVRTKTVVQFEGKALEFPCILPPGSPPVDLGWFVRDNGTLQRISSNEGRVSAYPSASKGRHSVVLKFRKLQQSDTNKYYCFDVTGKHNYTDAFARLNLTVYVKDPPAISPTTPEDLAAKESHFIEHQKSDKFSCSSPAAVNLECWRSNDQNGPKQQIKSDGTRVFVLPEEKDGNRSLVLKIQNLQHQDGTTYFCFDNRGDKYELENGPINLSIVNTNEPDSVELKTEKSNSVELEIPRMEPPAPAYLSLQIEPLSPVEGDMAKVVCTLNLTMGPLKNLLWMRYTDAGTSEEIVLNSSNFSRFSIESNRNETEYEEILIIKDLQLSDARDYGCYVPDRSLDALIPYAYIWLDVTPKH